MRPLSFPLCFLSRSESGPGDDLRAAGSLGARIPPARAATANSRARAALPRARFQPRISPRGARLDENRRLARLGDDSRRHTRELTGALDATVFFSAWMTRRRLKNLGGRAPYQNKLWKTADAYYPTVKYVPFLCMN